MMSSSTSFIWRRTMATKARSQILWPTMTTTDHNPQTLRADQGSSRNSEKWSMPPPDVRWPPYLPISRRPRCEDGLVPFDLDSPYQISKVVGEFYSVYYHRQHIFRQFGRVFRMSMVPERSSAQGGGAAHRRPCGGMSYRRSLPRPERASPESRESGARKQRFHLRRGHRAWPHAMCYGRQAR